MTYGSIEGVGELVPKWSGTNSDFSTTTRPTSERVNEWRNQISSIVDIFLAKAGIETPITEVDIVPALDAFVNAEVAAMAEGVNGSGKFGPLASKRGQSRYNLILKDVAMFVDEFKIGIERQGVTRNYSLTEGLSYRDTDESGDSTYPMFQRRGYGGDFFINWDDG